MEVEKKIVLSVSTAFRGENAGKGPSSIVLRSSVFLSVSAYQKVESVIFGLAMFAEGQSGLVPKTSQWSQPNLGKYAICASACAHTHKNTRTGKRAHTPWYTHTHTHKVHMMETNKQTARRPGFLCLSPFVAKKKKSRVTSWQNSTVGLGWKYRLPIHHSVHFSGRVWPLVWKRAE